MNIKQLIILIIGSIVLFLLFIAMLLGAIFTRLTRVGAGNVHFEWNDSQQFTATPCAVNTIWMKCAKYCQRVYVELRNGQNVSSIYLSDASSVPTYDILNNDTMAEWSYFETQYTEINGTGDLKSEVQLNLMGKFQIQYSYNFSTELYQSGTINVVPTVANVTCNKTTTCTDLTDISAGRCIYECDNPTRAQPDMYTDTNIFKFEYIAVGRSEVTLPNKINGTVQIQFQSSVIVPDSNTIKCDTYDSKTTTDPRKFVCDRQGSTSMYNVLVPIDCPDAFSFNRAQDNLHVAMTYSKNSSKMFDRLVLPYILTFVGILIIFVAVMGTILWFCRTPEDEEVVPLK
jgi:hypothetical protein